MPNPISYTDVRAMVADSQPKLLLGNGFSRACRNDIFSYDSLFESANFGALRPEARAVFDALNITDFEIVMKALLDAATLVRVYEPAQQDLAASFHTDAEGLKEVLVHAISDNHPSFPGEIEPPQYQACKHFLETYDRVYTLNYDLLLYWAYMQHELEPELRCDDGFRTPEAGPEDYVTWEIENTNTQKIFYLHGALHLFDVGVELQKYTWINTGERLIDQIRNAFNDGKYPLFVAEGESRAKMKRIKHSDYLSRCYRSFAAIGGDLVVFGHSFSENDDHILKLITRQRTNRLFVSLFGDPDSESNRLIVRRSMEFAEQRPQRRPLEVIFFDAFSANIWG